MPRRVVVVVGAGVAGLVAARELAGSGDRVLVLEADDRIGGALRAESLGAVAIDVGAEAFAVTRPETHELIDDLGLGGRVVAPRRADAHLLLDDGLHDLPPALLGVPTDLGAAAVVEVVGREQSNLAIERDSRPLDSVDPGVTLGALVRERMGDAVAERILAPVVAGVHAAHPDLVEAEAVLPGLLAAATAAGSLAGGAARLRAAAGTPGAAVAGLEGGMTILVNSLAEQVGELGADIRLGTGVTALVPAGSGWQVRTGAGRLEADAVVLAVDARTGVRVLAAVPDVGAALGRIVVGDVVVCAVVLDAAELDGDPVGSGLLVAPGHHSVRAKALTHASAKWDWIRRAYGPGRHLVRLSYGRDGRVDEPVAQLPAIVRRDLATVFGLDNPQIRALRVTRWDRSLVLPGVGHRRAVEHLTSTVAATPGLAVVGAGIGGNGLAGAIASSRGVTRQLDQR